MDTEQKTVDQTADQTVDDLMMCDDHAYAYGLELNSSSINIDTPDTLDDEITYDINKIPTLDEVMRAVEENEKMKAVEGKNSHGELISFFVSTLIKKKGLLRFIKPN